MIWAKQIMIEGAAPRRPAHIFVALEFRCQIVFSTILFVLILVHRIASMLVKMFYVFWIYSAVLILFLLPEFECYEDHAQIISYERHFLYGLATAAPSRLRLSDLPEWVPLRDGQDDNDTCSSTRIHRRGKKGGVRQRVRLWKNKPPLPTLTLANVWSIGNKIDEIRALTRFNGEFRCSSILCFTETWLHSSIPNKSIDINSFEIIRLDRSNAETKKSKRSWGSQLIWTGNGVQDTRSHLQKHPRSSSIISIRTHYNQSSILVLSPALPKAPCLIHPPAKMLSTLGDRSILNRCSPTLEPTTPCTQKSTLFQPFEKSTKIILILLKRIWTWTLWKMCYTNALLLLLLQIIWSDPRYARKISNYFAFHSDHFTYPGSLGRFILFSYTYHPMPTPTPQQVPLWKRWAPLKRHPLMRQSSYSVISTNAVSRMCCPTINKQ